MRVDEARVVGCILGGAIGDALGGPHEGKLGPISPTLSHTWRLSDDTQLTMATIEALVDAPYVSPARLAASFRRWFEGAGSAGSGRVR